MHIKKECVSTNSLLTPIIHQGNIQKHSHSVTVMNTCHIDYFVNICWGWVTCRKQRILHVLGKKINLKWRWSLSNKNLHENCPRFSLASNFCGKHKKPSYKVIFCGKDKNTVIWVTLFSIVFATMKISYHTLPDLIVGWWISHPEFSENITAIWV